MFRKLSRKEFLIYTLILLIGVLFGLILGYLVTKSEKEELRIPDLRLDSSYKFINPLLDCGYELDTAQTYSKTKRDIEDYIDNAKEQGMISDSSVYYRDLNNGPWFGINEKEPYVQASLVKLPLMITYFKLSEVEPDILTTKIKIENLDAYEDQNIKPSDMLEEGKEYTIETLINQMMIKSDNVAFDALLDYANINDYLDTYSILELNDEIDNGGEQYLSAKDYSRFFRVLYNSSYLNRELSEKALKILSETEYKDGLPKKLPADITIAHKFGERAYWGSDERALHDCGIVYVPNRPYMICIMTKGTNIKEQEIVINDISKIVYDAVVVEGN